MINILSQITFVHTCLRKFTQIRWACLVYIIQFYNAQENYVTINSVSDLWDFVLPALIDRKHLKCNVSLTLEDRPRVTDLSVWDYIPHQEEYVSTGAFLKNTNTKNKYSTRL